MNARKRRPVLAELNLADASERDVAAALGVSRRWLWQCKQVASLPDDEFEALVESDHPPTMTALVDLARRRAGFTAPARLCCPQCGCDCKSARGRGAVTP